MLSESGRPLLIAGSITRSSISGTVFVCWKETPESARALNAALPLLQAAQRVVIAHVSEAADPMPLGGVVSYLERHGIRVFGGCTRGFLDDARVPVLMMQ
jgi:hypothetical protein